MRYLAILLTGAALAFAQEPGRKSIHQIQSEHYWGIKGDKGAPQAIIPLNATRSPRVSKTVYGYDPYWVADTYIHWDLLTHFCCFSVDVNADGSLSNSHNFPALWSASINLAHKNGVAVTLCATCFSATTISSILSSAASRTNAARNLVALVRNAGCEGVNLDFEGLPLAQKQNLVRFVHELADSFHNWNPASHVSLATPAVDWSGAWDYDSLAIYADGLFIMAYDYGWSGSAVTMPVAPLDGYSRDVLWTIHDYVIYSGNRRGRLLAGFPYYGYDWPCVSSSPGAATTGGGSAVLYKNAAVNAVTYGRQWHSASFTPWYWYDSYRQCWYDDEVSLGYKYDAVWDSSLAGTGMWALSYDGDRAELWDALRSCFNVPADSFANGGMEYVFLDTAAVPTADSLRPGGWLEGGNAMAVTATDYVHSGGRALKHCVINRGQGLPYSSYLFQDVAAAPGTAYTLSGWARKNDGARNVMGMRVEWFDSLHRVVRSDTTAALSADSAGYKVLTTGSVTSPSATSFARIKLCVRVDSSNGFWDRWDDISFALVTGIDGHRSSAPRYDLSLEQNRPNPFKYSTMISYQIPKSGMVDLVVYNVAGQKVRTLVKGPMTVGGHSVRWDGRDDAGSSVAGGVYLYRLLATEKTLVGKMIILR